MDVLLIGSGGREHAIAWKLKQSKQLGKLYIAPGNAGTAMCGQNVAIKDDDVPGLVDFAGTKKVGLAIVGAALRRYRSPPHHHPSTPAALTEEDESALAEALAELKASEETPF